MEKELVRFENVTSYDMLQSNVKDMNFVIYEGQIVGMVALNDVGIDVLLHLLQTNTMDITGKIYIRGKLVHDHDYSDSSKNNISIIDHNNRLFKGLSTIDNIFVTPRPERHRYIIPKKKESSRFLWLKSELELDLPINKNCEDISNADRCIIEILRAVTAESTLIVLVGLLNFLTDREYKKVCTIIEKFCDKGQTFLMIGDNYNEIVRFTEFTILLRDGMSIKSFTREKYPDEFELLKCMEATFNECYNSPSTTAIKTDHVVLEFKHVYTEEVKDISFTLYKGQCVVLLANHRVQNNIMSLLQKKIVANEGVILFENKLLDGYLAKQLYPYGISFMLSNAYRQMPYMDLNYMENLTFGIEKKSKQYIVRKSIQRLLYTEAKKELGEVVDCCYLSELTKEERYRMLYSHIIFIHPLLAVICSPFIESDYHTRTFITELLYQLRAKGISLLILSANYSSKKYLADVIIEIHHKRIYSIYVNK